MSDELAQDEADAEDYDMDALERQGHGREDDDDAATLVNHPGRSQNRGAVGDDAVVFEVGEHDLSDDEDETKAAQAVAAMRREEPSREREHDGQESERQGLIGGSDKDD